MKVCVVKCLLGCSKSNAKMEKARICKCQYTGWFVTGSTGGKGMILREKKKSKI